MEMVEYRAIGRFSGYWFGSDGSAWSRWECGDGLARLEGSWLGGRWKAMRPRPVGSYFAVKVKEDGGRAVAVGLHRLILEAFRGPCPEGMEACHFPDPDPANNRIENLRWDTHRENCLDLSRHIAMGVREKPVVVRRPREPKVWKPSPGCRCSHHDRYRCLQDYYVKYGYPGEDDEFCECSCHVPEYLWDEEQ